MSETTESNPSVELTFDAVNGATVVDANENHGFVRINVAGSEFWRCTVCWQALVQQNSNSSVTTAAIKRAVCSVQKRTGTTQLNTGNICNHFRLRHPKTTSQNSSQQQSPNKSSKAKVLDRMVRYLSQSRQAFNVVDSEAFKEFISFVREASDEEFLELTQLTGEECRVSSREVCEAQRKDLLQHLSGETVSILMDLGTVGKHAYKKHLASFFLGTTNLLYFWRLAEVEGDESQGIEDNEWGRIVESKLHDIVVELSAAGVCVAQVVADNASAMQLATRLLQTKFPHILAGRCAVHSLMLVFGEMLGTPPFTELVSFLSACRQLENFGKIPETTEVKWMSFWSAIDYCLNTDRVGLLIGEWSESYVRKVQAIRDWISPMHAATLELQKDSASYLTLARSLSSLIAMGESEAKGFTLTPADRKKLQDLLAERWRTNFSSEALLMTVALNPTTSFAEMPAEIRSVVVALVKSKGAALLREKKKGMQTTVLRERLQFDLGRLAASDIRSEHAHDFVTHWTLSLPTAPFLGILALELAKLSISEAAVERGFAEMFRQFVKARNRMGNDKLEDIMFVSSRPWAYERPQFADNASIPREKVMKLIGFITSTNRNQSNNMAEKLAKGDRIGVTFIEGKVQKMFLATIHNRVLREDGSLMFKVTWERDGSVGEFDPNVDWNWYIVETAKEKKVSEKKRTREDDAQE